MSGETSGKKRKRGYSYYKDEVVTPVRLALLSAAGKVLRKFPETDGSTHKST